MSLIEWDQHLFEFVNTGMANGFLDAVMPLWRNKYVWAPLYVFIIAYFLINFGKRGYYVVLSLLLTAATSDLMSSRIIKNTVQRLRPCNNQELFESIIVRVDCGYGFSFTSSHATNHFAIAVFLICFLNPSYKWIRGFFFFWALSIAFGQVYVGVHYPLDVFAGSILGSVIGWAWYRFYRRYFPHPMRV